jgi:hypothetical protein
MRGGSQCTDEGSRWRIVLCLTCACHCHGTAWWYARCASTIERAAQQKRWPLERPCPA